MVSVITEIGEMFNGSYKYIIIIIIIHYEGGKINVSSSIVLWKDGQTDRQTLSDNFSISWLTM